MMKEDMWYLEIQKDLTYHIMKRKKNQLLLLLPFRW